MQPPRMSAVLLTVRAVLVIGLLLVIALRQESYHSDATASYINIERYHMEAVAGRKQILAVQQENQRLINEHIKAAMKRWDGLRENNRQIIVPPVSEPTATILDP